MMLRPIKSNALLSEIYLARLSRALISIAAISIPLFVDYFAIFCLEYFVRANLVNYFSIETFDGL